MKIIVIIEAQKATGNLQRQGCVIGCFRDGSLLMDCRDGQKPEQFYLTPQDKFPWGQFIQKMLVAWQLSDYENVPQEFRPLRRIPQFVLDNILKETPANQLKVLAALRQQGYFCSLPARKE